jgi:hypothetical protein
LERRGGGGVSYINSRKEKEVLERHLGLCPSEKELQEQHSRMFCHINTPIMCNNIIKRETGTLMLLPEDWVLLAIETFNHSIAYTRKLHITFDITLG